MDQPANKPETVLGVLKDEQFIMNVAGEIRKIIAKILSRPEPKPGFKYKKNILDIMISERSMNSEYFLSNIQSIWESKSILSAQKRYVIKSVCDEALRQTLLYYAIQKRAEKEAKEMELTETTQP